MVTDHNIAKSCVSQAFTDTKDTEEVVLLLLQSLRHYKYLLVSLLKQYLIPLHNNIIIKRTNISSRSIIPSLFCVHILLGLAA